MLWSLISFSVRNSGGMIYRAKLRVKVPGDRATTEKRRSTVLKLVEKHGGKNGTPNLNATKAAIRAGYSPKTARFIGCEDLTKPNIQAAIAGRSGPHEHRRSPAGAARPSRSPLSSMASACMAAWVADKPLRPGTPIWILSL